MDGRAPLSEPERRSHYERYGADDPAELRIALRRALDGMSWIGSIGGPVVFEGLTWPPDAEERLGRLRAALAAWSPLEPLPASVVEAARQGIVILNSTDASEARASRRERVIDACARGDRSA